MIKQRIMYVCSECAEGCPEACGHYDRTELRVMPDGAWLCESCFDNNDDNEFLSWGHLPAPEEYRRIPDSAQCAPDQEALQAAWAEGYEFGLNSRDKTPGAAALRALVIEECAKVCEDLRHDDYSAETSDWSGGTFDCASAIRAIALSEGMLASPDVLKTLEDNCWDLRCVDVPTGGGDADIGWNVVEHHMAPPQERVVGIGGSPLEAVQDALAATSSTGDAA